MNDPQADLIPLAQRIDALLPQTQCAQCGHPGCLPYADAIAAGADHNRCPPGGQATADALAALLQRPALPLDTSAGPHYPMQRLAVIREDECIGCTKCIQVCPVDAIVGAARLMHTVIADECTGCELCLPPCPVDCIDMVSVPDSDAAVQTPRGRARADHFRRRYQARLARLSARQAARSKRPRPMVPPPASAGSDSQDQLKTLQTRYKTSQRLWREANAALQRAERQGQASPAMAARVADLREQADALREQISQLMDNARQRILADTGLTLAALKQRAADTAVALGAGQRALASARESGDTAEIRRLQKQLTRLATEAAAAERTLNRALDNAGLGDDA